MRNTNIINRKYAVLLQALFVLIWMDNLIQVERFLPVYLMLGVFSLFCLWNNPWGTGIRLVPAALAVLFSMAAVWLNFSVFAPWPSLLSLSDMLMSLAGGSFVGYHIVLWLIAGRKRIKQNCLPTLIRVAAVVLWLVVLIHTDARYGVYIFCAAVGVLCICHNDKTDTAGMKRSRKILMLFAGLFSLAVVLANHALFTPFFNVRSLVSCGLCLIGGGFVGYHILLSMMIRLPVEGCMEARQKPALVFFLTFFSICGISMLYLWFSSYPGILTRDSWSTVEQILGIQAYNNTMPFWHTMLVQPFVRLGVGLTGDVDAGIALFHCFQIVFMALCFGCVMVTLYQIGVPKWILVIVWFAYACVPYNIVYSITLWKDVPFSGAGLLFVTGLYRLIYQVGRSRKLDYAMLIVGCLGFSLMRTNGWYAFLATVIVMALLAYKKHRKLLLIMTVILILCWVMINPVLDSLDVAETNLVEAFAVPMQQVARVVAEERPLTESEEELLSGIFWLDRVKEVYNPLSVDPIKFQTFRNENVKLITQNPLDYLKLYFQLGIKYPGDYLKAWVDETKGFWNAGYDYWIYSLAYVGENDNFVANRFVSLFHFLNDTEVLRLFSSTGLYAWGMIACCVLNILKKREEFLLSIPMLVLLIGLWLGTPVFCEFRYAYPVIVSLPLIACVTMYQKAETNTLK